MRAFTDDIQLQMLATCADLTNPRGGATGQPARHGPPVRAGGRQPPPEAADGLPGTNIDPWMAAAFAGVAHSAQTEEPFVLMSCLMNGQPAAMIAYAQVRDERTHFMPLFLAVQPWMKFSRDPRDEEEAEAA